MLLLSCTNKESIDAIYYKHSFLDIHSGQFIEGQAIAVNEGKIMEIGSESQIFKKYKAREKYNLKNQFLYPGFIDAHAHFWGYASNLQYVDLKATLSFDEVLERLEEFYKKNGGSIIMGRGWDQNLWDNPEMPTRQKLDEKFPDVPVYLTRIDGHALLVNSKALEINGLNEYREVEGGEITMLNGWITGLLIDNAMDLVSRPKPTHEEMLVWLQKAEKDLFASGLTSLADAGLPYEDLLYLRDLYAHQKLKIGFYGMASSEPETFDYFISRGFIDEDRFVVRSFKFYGDGALGSRGACLLEPYSDREGIFGLFLQNDSLYKYQLSAAFEAGFQVNTHAIGDSANRYVLHNYERVLGGPNASRWRVEHAQVVHPADYEYLKNLNIIPSVQPTHATSDMFWAVERLGHPRIKTAYAYRDLMIACDGLIALGTDFPVEDIHPLNTFFAAVVRKNKRFQPTEGFQTENALSRIDALRGMTLWAAYAQFQEDKIGSIEVGKWADFTLLDQNLLEIEEEKILKTQIKGVVKYGQIVYP